MRVELVGRDGVPYVIHTTRKALKSDLSALLRVQTKALESGDLLSADAFFTAALLTRLMLEAAKADTEIRMDLPPHEELRRDGAFIVEWEVGGVRIDRAIRSVEFEVAAEIIKQSMDTGVADTALAVICAFAEEAAEG